MLHPDISSRKRNGRCWFLGLSWLRQYYFTLADSFVSLCFLWTNMFSDWLCYYPAPCTLRTIPTTNKFAGCPWRAVSLETFLCWYFFLGLPDLYRHMHYIQGWPRCCQNKSERFFTSIVAFTFVIILLYCIKAPVDAQAVKVKKNK